MQENESKILDSWKINAENWILTLENNEIESRKLATNQAIINTILAQKPQRVIDIGCGEGWLMSQLAEQGVEILFGIDAIPKLIDNAQEKSPNASFTACTYQEIAQVDLPKAYFDVAVCNFSLLGKESTEILVKFLPTLLTKNGKVIIQTLHPQMIGQESSGWIEGSWKGMKREFSMPYDWYFRTLEDWLQLFKDAKLEVVDTIAPTHPQTQQPASIIFCLSNLIH